MCWVEKALTLVGPILEKIAQSIAWNVTNNQH